MSSLCKTVKVIALIMLVLGVLSIIFGAVMFVNAGALDAVLGEQGGGLSEGQAQRVAIARALLRPGNILLFDEATSALDVDTERRLLLNLRTHCAGKTIIFVTHHKAVADACDSVVKL